MCECTCGMCLVVSTWIMVCVMGVWCACVSGCDGGVYVVRCMAKVVDQPVSSAPLPGGRPPALGPSRGQAAASSCAGLWRSCLGPRPPASLHDPGMLHEGGGVWRGRAKGSVDLPDKDCITLSFSSRT